MPGINCWTSPESRGDPLLTDVKVRQAIALPELIRTHVWSRLGAEHDAPILIDGAGSAQLDGGLSRSLRDVARFGLMLVRDGLSGGEREYGGWSYRSCRWVHEAPDHVAFSAVGWLGRRVYANQEADVAVEVLSSAPQDVCEEKGAHGFQACEDLATLLVW